MSAHDRCHTSRPASLARDNLLLRRSQRPLLLLCLHAADLDTSWAEEEPPTAGVMPTTLGDYNPPAAPDHSDRSDSDHDVPDPPDRPAPDRKGRPAPDRGPRPAFRRLEPVVVKLNSDFLAAAASGWANFGMMILREAAACDISLDSSLAQ
jgi:hypothetical protein